MIGVPGYRRNRGALFGVQNTAPFNTMPNIGEFNARADDGSQLGDMDSNGQDQYQGQCFNCTLWLHMCMYVVLNPCIEKLNGVVWFATVLQYRQL